MSRRVAIVAGALGTRIFIRINSVGTGASSGGGW